MRFYEIINENIFTCDYHKVMDAVAELIRSDKLNNEADDMDVKNMLVACVMTAAKLS